MLNMKTNFKIDVLTNFYTVNGGKAYQNVQL